MKNVIVCDLDGTLADCEHRVHHVQRVGSNGLKRKPDWDAFYAGVKDDKVNQAVGDMLEMMRIGAGECCFEYEFIFCSGRPERCRADTIKWLMDVACFHPHQYTLLMRKDGDFRADYIIKQEILDAHIDKERVLFVLDDRQQVVDMWRRNGLTCFQVAPGDF